jgi:DNA-binding beta-propeller fold protein YncE
MSPANDNVFVALGTGGTEAVGFSASSGKAWGTAVSISLLAKGGSDNAVTVDPTSTYLYSAEAATNKLRVFTIANLQTEVDYPTGNGPSGILADPTSAYVYVANNTDNNISGFSQSAGVLTALTGSPFDSAKAPLGLVEDNSKTYVLNIGFGTNPNFYVYSYDATAPGTLDIKSTTSTATVNPSLSNAIAVTH